MDDSLNSLDILESSAKKFFLVLIAIIAIGMIMVLSSSYIYAGEYYNDSFHFFVRQLLFLGMGSALAYFVFRTKYSFWLKFSFVIHILACLVLALTLIPEIGVEVKGAKRWIHFMGFGIQPSEIVKYTILLASFMYFDEFQNMLPKERIKKALYLVFPLIVLILQPDFGTFSICLIGMAFACFVSRFPRKIFYLSLPVITVIGLTLLISQPYRVKRLLTFLDPWENPLGSGFQIIQSLYGFANGGLFGQGLGNSNEKLFYLPEAHNDFIFSVLGEELGFLGVAIVATLFLALVYFGLNMAMHMRSRKATYITLMLTFLLGSQAYLNMAVVLGLLPTKGMNLPFISYGGSSLVANLFAVGLIFSAVRHELANENQESESMQTNEYFRHSSFQDYSRPHRA